MTLHSTRLQIPSPEVADGVVIPGDFTSRANILDNAAMWRVGAIATRPAANTVVSGSLYFANDSDLKVLFVSDGTSWIPLSHPPNPFTTLPVPPKVWHGMEISLDVDPTSQSVPIWRMRYRTDDPSGPYWSFIGGSPMLIESSTWIDMPVSTSWVDLPAPGLVWDTTPYSGGWRVHFGAELDVSGINDQAWLSPKLGVFGASDDSSVTVWVWDDAVGIRVGNAAQVAREVFLTGTAPGPIHMQYHTTASAINVGCQSRFMAITPYWLNP